MTNSHQQVQRTVLISSIDIAKRARKAMGDIKKLADSIDRLGLLHPIVITPANELIVGGRRIEAFKLLGRTEIPANVAHNLTELQSLLEAECDENTCREDLTPEEAVELGKQFRPILKPIVEAEKKKALGGDRRSDKAKNNQGGASCTTLIRDNSKRLAAQEAAAVGMTFRTYVKAEAVVESKDKKLIDEMNRTGKVNGVYKRLVTSQKAEAINKEPPPLPDGPFRVIVCDPPWKYENRPDDPSHRAANPYPSMSVDEIKNYKDGKGKTVLDISHEDCVLWLWTTNSHLPYSFSIIESWGFEYKTMLTWAKNKMGLGDWLRGKTEHCLMCVRGKPTIQLTNQTTLLNASAGKHSAKPEEFYLLVEELCPGSKCEMFQRKARLGWAGHGDESGKL
jgi:N6-adenosine-specific RNA methylase IME4